MEGIWLSCTSLSLLVRQAELVALKGVSHVYITGVALDTSLHSLVLNRGQEFSKTGSMDVMC